MAMLSPRMAMLGRRAIMVINARLLSLHEHQSMSLLQSYGIPVAAFILAKSPREAEAACLKLGHKVVIKAQVLAGGRGKGHFIDAPVGFSGGVQVAKSCHNAAEIAEGMIGRSLVTHQTGSAGLPCNEVLVTEKVSIAHEFYLAAMIDGQNPGLRLVGSNRGGMDIEAVAKDNPADIVSVGGINLHDKSLHQILSNFVKKLQVPATCIREAITIVKAMLRLMTEKDATLIEINPLVLTNNNTIKCLDAKLKFDDNAEYRQKSLFKMRDSRQEDSREVQASKHNLNYIGLDGNIGCLVNGAGLAMATMDIIKLHGGIPANFLDVGGSADAMQIEAAISILVNDPNVKTILVNIFGGIMKCDTVAEGVVSAIRNRISSGLTSVPTVVRLLGTNVENASTILRSSKLDLIPCDDFDSAARLTVSIANLCEVAVLSGVNISIVAK